MLSSIINADEILFSCSQAKSELIYLGNTSNPQFLEKVSSGHFALYTMHEKSKIMTMQKSYDMMGPIMVNSYLQCK